jgi:uncharacterized protein YceH (UPF0502 family)
MILDAMQQRVLGALMEKEMTTPENYPLSLNALMAACNQRSSRDPVLDLTEDEVRQAVHSLEDMDIVSPVRDARVPKYEHRIRTVLNLRRDETAILCLLLLRGPQTPGELRGRSDRMFSFDDIGAVQSALERMAARTTSPTTETGPASGQTGSGSTGTGPLVVQLPRQPGSRESRYAHLLGGPVSVQQMEEVRVRPSSFSGERSQSEVMHARIEALEAEVASLRARVETLEGRS